MIRLTVPFIEEDDLQAVGEALASGFLVQGKRVAAFEQAVAHYVGSPHAVAVSNCTAALHLSLLALGVRPGDLVVLAAYSWPATANVIELCGAQPAFVDIQPDTFNLDPNGLEQMLGRLMASRAVAQRVKAIIPVHTFGQLADMQAIVDVAGRFGLPVLEDAACALGATHDGRQAGTWGRLGCFSFHPRKAITTGEGGLVVTGQAELARQVRMLRNHGLDPDAPGSDFLLPGFNCRMTELQAALGCTQMAKLAHLIDARQQLARYYDGLLAGTPLQPPVVRPANRHVYQSYVVLLPEEAAAQRTAIIARLKERGIETTIGTWHMPLITYYRTRYGYRPGDFPVADAVFQRALTLPLYKGLQAHEQDAVIHQLLAAVQGTDS